MRDPFRALGGLSAVVLLGPFGVLDLHADVCGHAKISSRVLSILREVGARQSGETEVSQWSQGHGGRMDAAGRTEVAARPFVKFLDLPNYGITDRVRE